MFTGVGTDIVEIKWVVQVLKTSSFLNEYFSESERNMFLECNNSPQCIAENFAVKEAFMKAIGVGIHKLRYGKIEVLRRGIGTPYIRLIGHAQSVIGELCIDKFHVSISNTNEFAIGYVIAERR